MKAKAALVGLVNDRVGGQWHPNAKRSDREVELVRALRDVGLSYREIAIKLELKERTVRAWAAYERRARGPERFAAPKRWAARRRATSRR